MRTFEAPDGTPWRVRMQSPGASNVMLIFSHPDGSTARRDRYAWYNITGPEARDVTGRVDPKAVLEGVTDEQLGLLFRRSMLIAAADDPLGIPVVPTA
jgi:hypothetical protein